MPTFRNASILALGQLGTYGCSFARNMFLARALSKADFGLASVFALAITLLEMTGRMSLGTQIIQSPNGEREDFQQTYHAVLAAIGLISSIVIAASAIPLSKMLGVPNATWAFALLGLVPLLKGFEHLDNYRLRRDFNFTPGILCEIIPQIIVTIAVWPLTVWLGDFRVILWVIIGKAGLSVILSHLFAKRVYRWALKREFLGAMFSFSWPLLLNGFLIVLSQQADQFLIASFLGLDDVAIYSAAFSFSILPYFFLAPIQGNLFLPSLSRLKNSPIAFELSYTECLVSSALFAAFTFSPIISAGEHIVVLLYGAKYQGAGLIVALLAAACSIRCIRVAPAIAAIAKADTKNQFYSNLVRCTSIGLVYLAFLFTSNLVIVAGCSLFSEIAATIFSIFRLKKTQNIPPSTSIKPMMILTFALSLSSLPAVWQKSFTTSQSIKASMAILLIEILLAKILFPETYKNLKRLVFNKFRTA